ncbi:MAG: molybdopterin-dependent oxidoreductase [Coriobacteriia bacterium]|nr:molybdopterin-dependent oxidoreductase [Coriobacteriia bacterium]
MTPIRVRFTALLLCAALLALAGCGVRSPEATDGATGNPLDLESVEVRGYRGEKLGSAADFRENSIKGPQDVDINTYRLEVAGKVASPTALSYDEVLDGESYEKVVTLYCVEGWSVRILWEGVLLTDLLKQAGYDPEASTVIFRCADGYTTSLPLSVIEDRRILLAYKMNGIPLPKERGFPFQVVAEDRWGYKWAKWVTGIEVSDDADYEGYWESRGYDNEAELPEKDRSKP